MPKPKKPRQQLLVIVRCAAQTRTGKQCSFRQKHGSFCGKHEVGKTPMMPVLGAVK